MKNIIALALAATLAAPAFAASDFYIGTDVGQTRVDEGGVKFRSTGVSVYGGYQVAPNIAIEAGYRNLGSDTVFGVKTKGSAWQASALFLAPLSTDFSLFGRLGVNRVEGKGSATGFNIKTSDTRAFFGIGGRYALSQQVGLRAEFQKPDSDTKVFSAGIDFRF
ncbi:outer membrane beta-barrel protein [Paucibacter sp. M5-1]|uniref:outer membrane beta-barrel protein n=1 Tax=Paucibacter sp. M5-1 TaxID=3015998 RepID=UPI0022B8EBFD|nr:outer membrane beta-barrel protein [Paucibacter sp. M5-1]MCZ7884245.1 outer membrane beta-barrel protein [Paucibacter sp. M5-1]